MSSGDRPGGLSYFAATSSRLNLHSALGHCTMGPALSHFSIRKGPPQLEHFSAMGLFQATKSQSGYRLQPKNVLSRREHRCAIFPCWQVGQATPTCVHGTVSEAFQGPCPASHLMRRLKTLALRRGLFWAVACNARLARLASCPLEATPPSVRMPVLMENRDDFNLLVAGQEIH